MSIIGIPTKARQEIFFAIRIVCVPYVLALQVGRVHRSSGEEKRSHLLQVTCELRSKLFGRGIVKIGALFTYMGSDHRIV